MDDQDETRVERRAIGTAAVGKVMHLVSTRVSPELASLRIVVIDDESVLLELIVEMLSAMGHSALTFSNAEAALTELAVSSHDIIFADLRMPGMSGQEFYHRLTAVDAALAARVVFLTGDAADMQTRRFLKESGRRWLAKPFTFAALAKCLKTVIPGRSTISRLEDQCA